MELQELKGFVAVALNKSFSKAAEKTRRSQPAISLQVQSLEKELGVKLFDRISPRKLEITEEGKTLLELASPLVDDFDSLRLKFKEKTGSAKKGSVRIATHTSVMVYILPDSIKRFKKKYPDCDLSIVNRGRQDIINMLSNGEVDLGIASLKQVPANIDYKPFANYDRVLIAAKGHPLSKKKTISLEDISGYPLLVPPQGSNTRRILDRVFAEHELEYKIAMEATGRLAIKAYVEMNLGISIINEFYLSKEDKQKFFIKNVSNYFGTAERGLLIRKNKYQSKALKEFMGLFLSK